MQGQEHQGWGPGPRHPAADPGRERAPAAGSGTWAQARAVADGSKRRVISSAVGRSSGHPRVMRRGSSAQASSMPGVCLPSPRCAPGCGAVCASGVLAGPTAQPSTSLPASSPRCPYAHCPVPQRAGSEPAWGPWGDVLEVGRGPGRPTRRPRSRRHSRARGRSSAGLRLQGTCSFRRKSSSSGQKVDETIDPRLHEALSLRVEPAGVGGGHRRGQSVDDRDERSGVPARE